MSWWTRHPAQVLGPTSAKSVWLTLAAAVAVVGAWCLLTSDPWDWLPSPWLLLPSRWEPLVLSGLLVVLAIPIVRGISAIRSGRTTAWWPTIVATLVFVAWAFIVVIVWVMWSIPDLH